MKSLLVLVLCVAVAIAAPPQDEAPPAEPAVEEAPPADAAVEEAPPADAAVEEAVATDGSAATTDAPVCGSCPEVSVQHYKAKQCEPVYDRALNPCCPVSYKCPDASAYTNTPTTCLLKGVTYNIGDVVPVAGPCRKECTCQASLLDTYPAEVVCHNTECPTSHFDVKAGCRLLFDVDQCCAVGVECSEQILSPAEVIAENATLRQPDCTAQGRNFFKGDVMPILTAPCQHCVCTEGYDNTAYGPGCTTIDCGIDYKFAERLKSGCVPLYSVSACCPTDWVCPGGNIMVNIPNPAFANVTENYCEMGAIRAPAGMSVATSSCSVNCVCSMPPDFTCVAYPSCEMALSSLHVGILP